MKPPEVIRARPNGTVEVRSIPVREAYSLEFRQRTERQNFTRSMGEQTILLSSSDPIERERAALVLQERDIRTAQNRLYKTLGPAARKASPEYQAVLQELGAVRQRLSAIKQHRQVKSNDEAHRIVREYRARYGEAVFQDVLAKTQDELVDDSVSKGSRNRGYGWPQRRAERRRRNPRTTEGRLT